MAVLIAMSGDHKGDRYEIETDEVTMGRKPDCTIVLDNPTISGHHCSILRKDGLYTLQDMNSTNGTRLNSQRVTGTAPLKAKDLIQAGSLEFMIDGDDIRLPETESFAEVEVAEGAAVAPDSFANISPFGTKHRESKGLSFTIAMILAVIAAAALAFFIFALITAV